MKAEVTVTVDSLLDELRSTYTKAISDLDSERAALENEFQGILKAAEELKLLLPAKGREAQRAADALLLKGKGEEAAAKIAEQHEAEAAPATMKARQEAISARIEQIEAEKQAVARRVFQERFPQLRAVLVAEQRAMCDDLDLAWAGVQRFAQETGTIGQPGSLLTANLPGDLTARENGEEKIIFERLLNWFGRWGRQ